MNYKYSYTAQPCKQIKWKIFNYHAHNSVANKTTKAKQEMDA